MTREMVDTLAQLIEGYHHPIGWSANNLEHHTLFGSLADVTVNADGLILHVLDDELFSVELLWPMAESDARTLWSAFRDIVAIYFNWLNFSICSCLPTYADEHKWQVRFARMLANRRAV